MTQAGLRGTNSAAARDWLGWGSSLDEPRKGAINVFRRFDPNNPRAGHVAFFWDSSGDRYLVLGGNQDDQVSIMGYPKADLLGFRGRPDLRPSGPARKEGPVVVGLGDAAHHRRHDQEARATVSTGWKESTPVGGGVRAGGRRRLRS
ncbi:MAG: hypothetical protein ACR2JP_01570 [Acidimicrobiia bacterium]